MTPTEIKAVMKEIGGGANKRLGQNFLVDGAVLEVIVEEGHIHPASVVLEIGPGLGVLTGALLERGAEVVAIERDRRFIDYLNAKFNAKAFTVVQGDAADLEWGKVVGDREWSFVSNLPYSITSLALRKALWSKRPPENVIVLVQREVAERATSVATDVAGHSGKSSLLSLMVAFASTSARIVKRVAPGAFYPAPKVESAILQIDPMPWPERVARWGMDPEKIMEVAKRGFAHPRKFLASNLSLTPEQRLTMKEVGIAEKARAEDLSADDWARLAAALTK